MPAFARSMPRSDGPWRGLRRAAVLWAALALFPAQAQEPEAQFFHIGTGPAGGTYFQIGGTLAEVITGRKGARECAHGACGVEGLIAVAETTRGSVENADLIRGGRTDSGIAQADVAYWTYMGQWVYAGRPPAGSLRAIANLYVEAVHLVVRRDSGIGSVADLKGKRVSLGEIDSGTFLSARIVLGGFGLTEGDLEARHLAPGPSGTLLRQGKLDAMFVVAGPPAPTLLDLAAATAGTPSAIDLVPIAGPEAERIAAAHPFYGPAVVPGGLYRGVGPTPTLGVSAQWLISAKVADDLAYQITRALWHQAARKLLDSGHPQGHDIRLETALRGLAVPLHPGAARYYREKGLLKGEASSAPDE